jgi:hypothetical protein
VYVKTFTLGFLDNARRGGELKDVQIDEGVNRVNKARTSLQLIAQWAVYGPVVDNQARRNWFTGKLLSCLRSGELPLSAPVDHF